MSNVHRTKQIIQAMDHVELVSAAVRMRDAAFELGIAYRAALDTLAGIRQQGSACGVDVNEICSDKDVLNWIAGELVHAELAALLDVGSQGVRRTEDIATMFLDRFAPGLRFEPDSAAILGSPEAR